MTSLPLQQLEGGRYARDIRLCLVLILSVMTVSTSSEAKVASVRDLRAKLFENYDKLVRPVVDDKTVTQVFIGLAPNAITDLDEEKQIMELDTWLLMRWKDEYLVWNPQEYGGVTTFNIPSTEIWLPDVTIYTGSPAKKIVIEVFTNAIVNYTGDVLWVPPVNIRNRCPLESYGNHQRETLTCVVKLGSWTYHEYKLDLQLHEKEVKLADFFDINPNWELVSITADRQSKIYACCQEPYPFVDYKLNLRRRSNSKSCPRYANENCQHHHHHPFMSRSSFHTGCD